MSRSVAPPGHAAQACPWLSPFARCKAEITARMLALLSMGLGAAVLAGCGRNPCAELEQAFNDKCATDPIPLEGPEPECPDDAAELAECLLICLENADCNAINGTDPEGSAVYVECVLDCGVEP